MIETEATLAELRRLLDRAEARQERVSCILPSTAPMLHFAAHESRSKPIAVLAPSMGETHRTSTFLARVADARHALIFSDQLTSARDAPWLIEWQGERKYFSRIEYMLHAELEFQTWAWTLSGFCSLPTDCSAKALARLLHAYLVSCHGLRAQWLARAQQDDRVPRRRRVELTKRLQLFRSSVLAGSTDALPSAELRRVLEHLDQLFDALRKED